jgi:hypothetical protein
MGGRGVQRDALTSRDTTPRHSGVKLGAQEKGWAPTVVRIPRPGRIPYARHVTLKHRLESAHSALEAAAVEARRRVRLNEGRHS